MKIINIGILTHVDAGKTTLTESLLYTSGAIEALEPWEQREIMRLVGKFSHVLNEECEAFKRQVAAENEANDKGEGETCDS